jgi:predicted dehydrogenase
MRPKVGIIGAGVMGTTHGKANHFLFKNGIIDGELVAIAEEDQERRERYAAASRARLSFATAEELIASPEVNTVYICTPTFNHLELAQKVAAAGKALFCEKPLAFNATDATLMRDAAREAGIVHQVGLVMRFSPVVWVTRELVMDAASGRTMACVMVDDQFFPIQGHYQSTWRGDVTKVGAGTLLEHAIHDIDLLLWMFGPVRRVHGVTSSFFEKEGIEDVSSAMLEFESGAVVNHVSVWHNLLHRGSSRRMHVICENAQYSWEDDDYAGAIRCESNTTSARTDISSEEVIERFRDGYAGSDARLRQYMSSHDLGQSYLLENYTFLKAVSDGKPSWLDFEVAVQAHTVVDAIYASARTGRPVDV